MNQYDYTLQLPDGDKIFLSFNPINGLPLLSPVIVDSTCVLSRSPAALSVKNVSASFSTLRPIARHIPTAQIRVFRFHYFLQFDDGSLFVDKYEYTLQLPDGDEIYLSFNPINNLPILSPVIVSNSLFSFNTVTQSSINDSIASESNRNITSNQTEFLV